jgi:YhcH/YjgK/YiaL family protein
MIFDKIENSAIYENINPLIKKAFEYLKQTDFCGMENGKHIIDGNDLFALVQEYDTKNDADVKLEAHRKYIDVQYVISGEELIGVRPLINQKPYKEYDAENDYALYDDTCSFVKMSPRQFAVLFPHDLHKPGISPRDLLGKVDSSIKVKKVVIKVRAI